MNLFDIIFPREHLRLDFEIVKASFLYNDEFYIGRYGLASDLDGVKHFCKRGWKRGYNPSEFFNSIFYLNKYPDVRQSGLNPLIHYLRYGARERRTPSLAFDVGGFCEAHQDRLTPDADPAELCIALYGGYDWKGRASSPMEVGPEVAAKFRQYFDEEFYRSMNPDVAESGMKMYEHFIAHGQYEDRDPAPAFDIYEYKREIARGRSPYTNPLVHHVRFGDRSGGPEYGVSGTVLDPQSGKSGASAGTTLTIGVHAHCYYPELIAEILPRLRAMPAMAMIVVTVISVADRQFIENVFKRERFDGQYQVRVVPNRGRDLGPLLVACRDLWFDYDILLHVHTKRSPHVVWGDNWRRYLLDQTMGSSELVATILKTFEDEPDLGCLYPRNFHMIRRFLQEDANAGRIDAALSRLGHQGFPWRGSDFPAGSMAWYRTAPLRALIEAYGVLECFEDERGQLDATFAHVLERLLPIAVRAAGSRVVSYITPRRARPASLTDLPEREDSAAAVPARWHRDTARIARRPLQALAPLSQVYNGKALDLHWIIPSFARGAGGHMTIFRMVELLEGFGHHQTIWIQNAVHFPDQAAAKRAIRDWYRPVGERVHVRFLPEDVRELAGDCLIVTDCWTAFPASEARNFKERFYFVQDYEPSFHPMGELQLLAESTYDFGFPTLCAGRWLNDLMTARGLWARSWDLCADHAVYYPGMERSAHPRVVRIAFYARGYTPRRAVGLGLAALEELHRRGVAFHADLFGEADLAVPFVFPHTNHGILSPEELGDLYRDSDIGLVFSATNYSLVPLEMMACDLPVVEIDAPSTRAIFRDGEVTFAKPLPTAIADAIEGLMADPQRRERQRRKGRDFVTATSWEGSARMIEAALFERLRERGFTPVDPERCLAPSVHRGRRASVFIPTYNAGRGFARILDAVLGQRCAFDYDVLIIDSGSTDGTPDLIRRRHSRRLRMETIPSADFQHGRTRNRGIERTDGTYVALLTQDALPRDDLWLSHLISGFERGPRVAGVIGRHEAYPEHDAFTRRDLREMFDTFALLPSVIDRETGLPSFLHPGGGTWRRVRQFYSDNNSAMARAAWALLPYPDIDWGEDQVWADEMLRAGFQKAYVNEAVVLHSHPIALKRHGATSLTEGEFWGRHFGFDLHPKPKAAIAAMDARDEDFALRSGIAAHLLAERKRHNRVTVEGRAAGYAQSLQRH